MTEENQTPEEASVELPVEGADEAVLEGNDEAVSDNEPEEGDSQAETEEKPDEDSEDTESNFEPFPKKAKNAIQRRDRQIAKLRAELREMQMAQQQAIAKDEPKQTGAPREEDFDNYAEFLEAKVMHKMREEMQGQTAEAQKTQEQRLQEAQHEQFVAKKMQEIGVKVQEHDKLFPGFQQEFAEVYEENADILDYISPEIERIFFEADDTALAFYNLAKSGQLVDVIQMNPYQAAMAIAKAQMQPIMPKAPQKKAPAPITAARGTGKTQKSLADLEGDALLERLESLSSY